MLARWFLAFTLLAIDGLTPRDGWALEALPAVEPMTEELPLSLEWEAPPGCPQATDVRGELRASARVRRGVVPAALVASGSIARRGGRFVLRLSTELRGERGTTVLEAARCPELQRVATLVLLLVFGDSAELLPGRGSREPERPPADNLSRAPVERLGWRLEMGLAAALGLTPKVGLGPRVGAALRYGAWLERFDGGAYFTGPTKLSDRVEASFWAGTVGVSGCRVLLGNSLSLAGCAGLHGGFLLGSASGALQSRSAVAPWYAVTSSVLLMRETSHAVWLFSAGAAFVPVPPLFVVEGAGSFEGRRWVPTVALGVGF